MLPSPARQHAAKLSASPGAARLRAAKRSQVCPGPSRTRHKLWGGMAVKDVRQRRPALLAWLFQHVCPDAGLDAACPAEEEGEPRRIGGFLFHTHATTVNWHDRQDAGRSSRSKGSHA